MEIYKCYKCGEECEREEDSAPTCPGGCLTTYSNVPVRMVTYTEALDLLASLDREHIQIIPDEEGDPEELEFRD